MSARELDHVAFAVPQWESAGTALNRRFGARYASGFHQQAFSPCQLELAEGMRLELLAPPESNTGFLAQFLDSRGRQPSAHHITFKVADIRASLELARAAGVRTILENLDNPWWKELFLHPKDTGLGFLVQLVQTELTLDGQDEITAPGSLGCPWEQLDSEASPAQRLDYIYGRVFDEAAARRTLGTVLGGAVQLLAGNPLVLHFCWPHGAQLVLEVAPESTPGLRTLSFSDPDTPAPAPNEQLLGALRQHGVRFPELGIGVLQQQPARSA